jgi:hypothetical protein
VADCLLLGHGGYRESNGMCTIGAGLSITFYCQHGNALKIPQAMLIKGPKAGGYQSNEKGTGVTETYNYSLGKAAGKHAKVQEEYQINYEKIAAAQNEGASQDYCPHIVTVSNHNLKGRILTLKEIIAEVCRHDRNIRNFHFGACREPF